MDQGNRDLQLAARLEAIRLKGQFAVGPFIDFTPRDKNYEGVFCEAGFGPILGDPEAIAARVKASSVNNALVAALDDWTSCTTDPVRQIWLLKVAALADPDSTEWRAHARDPDIRKNDVAFAKVLETAPVGDQSAALLVALARHWRAKGQDAIPFMRRVQQAHPDDFWINFWLGYALAEKNNHTEAIRYYQAVLAARPETPSLNNNLALSLTKLGRNDEAVEQYYRALEIDLTVAPVHYNLAICLLGLRRYDESIQHIQKALPSYPKAAILHTALGHCLEKKGRHDEALIQHQQAVALEPNRTEAQKELRTFLMRQGKEKEARAAWQQALEAKPTEHDAWYGYAELCLFLGKEDEYRRARKALLAAFGTTADPYIAERTGRACLLLPATGDDLRQAVASRGPRGNFQTTQVFRCLHAFPIRAGPGGIPPGAIRPGNHRAAGDAFRNFGPTPRLVLALALHQKGQAAEARKALANAILVYDWRAAQVRDQDGWICHALRREAERLIVPDLPAFLAGKYQPRDNDERLALLGVCQFTNRTVASARLYADAFAADPRLAADLGAGHRHNAARFAAWQVAVSVKTRWDSATRNGVAGAVMRVSG